MNKDQLVKSVAPCLAIGLFMILALAIFLSHDHIITKLSASFLLVICGVGIFHKDSRVTLMNFWLVVLPLLAALSLLGLAAFDTDLPLDELEAARKQAGTNTLLLFIFCFIYYYFYHQVKPLTKKQLIVSVSVFLFVLLINLQSIGEITT